MIEPFNGLRDKLDCVIIVAPMDDPGMTVDMACRHADDKVGNSTTVEMNCPCIGSTALEHIELVRDPKFFGKIDHEIAEPEIRNHTAVPEHDDRAFAQFLLGLVFLDIGDIASNSYS